MSFRYDSPVPPPPKRSKSSMCAPHSNHRKLTAAVNRSSSMSNKMKRKRFFLSDRFQKHTMPQAQNLKSQQTEDLLAIGREEMNSSNFEGASATFTSILSIDASHVEAYYCRGMCLYKAGRAKSAIPDFLRVISMEPLFNKFAYYLLASCFEQIGDTVTAIRYASKSIYHFPRFHQGYLLRGNLYNIQQKCDKALSDFRKALEINAKDGSALLGMAQSLEKIGDFATSYRILTQAMTYPEVFASAIIQRAQLLMTQNKSSMALNDFNYLLEKESANVQAYFYKGKALIENGDFSNALLSFEQCIKYDKELQWTSKAVYYLGYLKVKEKDFYGAIHQLDRITEGTVEQKLLRTYAEGVIFLIKRKFKEGISSFVKLLKKKNGFGEYTLSCYEYLAFAYCSLKLFSKALKYLKQGSGIGEISKASLYNLEIVHGYICAEKKEFAQSGAYFKKASMIFPSKPEPLLFQSSLILEEATKEEINPELVAIGESLLEKAVSLRQDSESSFYRGIARYLLAKFPVALEDSKLCIEKADENVAEHYVFRGLCYAALSNYQEAVNDFSVALQLDENLDFVYDFRGRCAYLMDDSDLAYMDFQKLVNLNDSSPKPYIQTAVVLMHSSSFSGAIASLENANSITYTVQAGLLKIKAYILEYDIESALNELNILLDFDQNLTLVWRDREILAFLSSLSQENNKNFKYAVKRIDKLLANTGEIFDTKMILWYKGVFLLYLCKFEEAVANFQQIIEIIQHSKAKASSEEALTIEEQNCEVLYNIALCYISTDKSKTVRIFSDLSKILNKKHKGQILFLCALLEIELKNPEKAQKYMEDSYQNDPETVSPYLSKQSVILKPLNTTNTLAATFPYLEPFHFSKVKLRPAICLPKPSLPPIDFKVETKVVDFIKISKIAPKPEPPWLKRSRGAIMFTDNMVDLEHEPISNVISKTELLNPEKKVARSGVLMRKKSNISDEKESSYLQSNDEDQSVEENEPQEIPEAIAKKIREMCFNLS